MAKHQFDRTIPYNELSSTTKRIEKWPDKNTGGVENITSDSPEFNYLKHVFNQTKVRCLTTMATKEKPSDQSEGFFTFQLATP